MIANSAVLHQASVQVPPDFPPAASVNNAISGMFDAALAVR
jgi:hypothetical protein